MKNMTQKALQLLRLLRTKAFAVSVLAVFLSVTVYAVSATTNTVYIHDGTTSVVTYTTEEDLDAILAEQGIEVEPEDIVEFTGFASNIAEVYITRAFDVSVTADGQTHELSMTGGTVRDALHECGLSIDADDLISKPLYQFVEAGDEIVINRVAYQTTEVRESIPFEEEQLLTPLLSDGRSEILTAGREGEKLLTYSQRTIDGVVEESTLIAEDIVRRPTTQVSLVGADVPVSDLDFGYTIENNAPTTYKQVFTGVKATGYSASAGAHGASGNTLYYGHVAVNPNIIPYNSKLYITSADGEFVYGYAIASDTGYAMMDGRSFIDLFYETYRESQLNGAKTVNVYVLE